MNYTFPSMVLGCYFLMYSSTIAAQTTDDRVLERTNQLVNEYIALSTSLTLVPNVGPDCRDENPPFESAPGTCYPSYIEETGHRAEVSKNDSVHHYDAEGSFPDTPFGTLTTQLLLLSPQGAQSPNITGVTLSDHSLTITGTGFGFKSPAAPLLFDTFDDDGASSGDPMSTFWSGTMADGPGTKYIVDDITPPVFSDVTSHNIDPLQGRGAKKRSAMTLKGSTAYRVTDSGIRYVIFFIPKLLQFSSQKYVLYR